jgi:hypothetical protein
LLKVALNTIAITIYMHVKWTNLGFDKRLEL